MPESPLVTSRTEGMVALVAFNRPEKRNAISRDVLRALAEAITAAERDPAVRAIVLYGEGRVFSAGVDFTMLAGDVEGRERVPFRAQVGEMQALVTRSRPWRSPSSRPCIGTCRGSRSRSRSRASSDRDRRLRARAPGGQVGLGARRRRDDAARAHWWAMPRRRNSC
jgi:hypothetical protein